MLILGGESTIAVEMITVESERCYSDLIPGLIVNSCDHIGFCDETVRYGLD